MFVISTFFASAQESGWADSAGFKEQKLKIPGLTALHFNEDGSKFYTLHGKKVYYWKTLTGELIDSLDLPGMEIPRFSSDGRTICYCGYVNLPTDTMILPISIYDLKTKKLITRSNISVPGSRYYYYVPYSEGWIECDVEIQILDYNYNANELTCAVSFGHYWNSSMGGYDPYEEQAIYYAGASGIFNVQNNVLVKKIQLSKSRVNDLKWCNNSIFRVYYIYHYEYYDGNSINSKSHTYNFGLDKHDFSNGVTTNLFSLNYNNYSSYVEGQGSSSGSSGIYKPFSTLIIDSAKNLLYMRATNTLYVFSLVSNLLIDSIDIENSAGFLKTDKEINNLIYCADNKILTRNFATKQIIDSIKLPIAIKDFEIIPNGEAMIVASGDGRILLYKAETLDTNLNFGWRDKGDYLETRVSNYALKQIVVPSGKNYILTVDNNNALRKINFQGEIIETENLSNPVYSFQSISQDGLSLNFIRSEEIPISLGMSYQLYWMCKSPFTNDTIFEKWFYTNVKTSQVTESDVKFYLNYCAEKLTGVAACSVEQKLNNIETNNGDVILYDKKTDSLSSLIYGEGYVNCKLSSDFSKSLFSLMSREEYNAPNDSSIVETKRLDFFTDLNPLSKISISYLHSDQNEPNNNVYGFIPEKFAIAENKDYFVANDKNYLYRYFKNVDNYAIVDSFSLENTPLNINFSNNDRYVILSSSDARINIYDFNNYDLVRTYDLQDSLNSTVVCVPYGKEGFFSGNQAGFLKYFRQDSILTSVNEDRLKAMTQIIFPNPVNDYMLIRNSIPYDKLEIYNILGIKVFESEYKNVLELSKLLPGTYFLKLGNHFVKFVKM